MIGVPYWDRRLHLWGAWLATGSGRLSSTPLARLRQIGVRIQSQAEQEAPFVHEVERETDQMVKTLPARWSAVLDAFYRSQCSVNQLAVCYQIHPDTIRGWIRDSHKRLQRQLDDRRRGRPHPAPTKAVNVLGDVARGRGRTLASVVPEK
jgi:hypothetical protein